MISAYEDAIVKAASSIVKGERERERLARNQAIVDRDRGRMPAPPKGRATRSPAERGDVSNQSKPAPKAPVDPERQEIYDKIDQISEGQSSTSPQPSGGIMGAAKKLADRASGAVSGAASGARDAVMGTDGGEQDQTMQRIMNRPGSAVSEGTRQSAEGEFSGSPGLVGAAKDIAGRAVEGAQGMASSAMTRGKGILGAAKSMVNRGKDAFNRVNTPENRAAASEAMSRTGQRVGQGIIGAAKTIGRGAVEGAKAAGRGYSSLASEVVPRVDAAGAAAGRGLVQGAKALASGTQRAAGRMAYGEVDPATGQRVGRGSSGFINPDDKLGTAGAAIRGALTGQGAMPAIEARNERRLGLDREQQAGVRSAARDLTQMENRGNLRGSTQQAMINESRGGNMAPINTMSTTGSTMSTGAGAGAPAAGGAAPAAPAPGGAAPAAGGAAPTPQGNQTAENILAQRAGAQLADADARANTRTNFGSLGANVLGLGLPAALGAARSALTRRGGRRDQKTALGQLNTLAGTDPSTFAASSDDPYDDFWDLQKTMHTFRIRDSTEALRYAYQ